MEILSAILYLLAMATAIPVGLFLAWLCDDEIVDGQKWFRIILYFLVLVGIVFLFVYQNIPMLLSLVYMIIVTCVSIFKGRDMSRAVNRRKKN